MKNKKKLGVKLLLSIIASVALVFGLVITTYAYILVSIGVEDNFFQTGVIKINLNDGNPVITEDEYLFEPGMTVEKKFFVENESSFEVYYRVYFEDIQGNLAEALEVTLKSEDGAVIYQGTLKDMTRENMKAADSSLKIGEAHWFTISFYFPEEKDNMYQNKILSFSLSAEAVQAKNNPDRVFD